MRVLVLAATGAVVILASACGDQPAHERVADERADQVREAAQRAGLADDVTDVLVTAATSVRHTFRVTYGGGPGEPDVVVTQDPPRRRIDVDPGATGVARSSITDGEQTSLCTRIGGVWACEDAEVPPDLAAFDPGDVVRVAEDLAAARDDYVLRVTTRTIAGTSARCLESTLKPGVASPSLAEHATLCVSAEGALLLVEGPSAPVRATAYTTEVADDAFDVPAEEPD